MLDRKQLLLIIFIAIFSTIVHNFCKLHIFQNAKKGFWYIHFCYKIELILYLLVRNSTTENLRVFSKVMQTAEPQTLQKTKFEKNQPSKFWQVNFRCKYILSFICLLQILQKICFKYRVSYWSPICALNNDFIRRQKYLSQTVSFQNKTKRYNHLCRKLDFHHQLGIWNGLYKFIKRIILPFFYLL